MFFQNDRISDMKFEKDISYQVNLQQICIADNLEFKKIVKNFREKR